MTARDFCFWLQGFFELGGVDPTWGINADRSEVIRRHLTMVFAHDIDPKTDQGSAGLKKLLDHTHAGGKTPDLVARC